MLGKKQVERELVTQLPAESDFEIFSSNLLFIGLNQIQIETLFSLSKEISLKEGDYLMKEGEKSNEVYFIIDGSLEISKFDTKYKRSHIIAIVHSGETVGEMALLEQKQRSASIKALTPARLRTFTYDDLINFINTHKEFNTIYYQLSKNINERLVRTTEIAFSAMQEKVEEYQTRSEMGLFLVCVVTALCLFTFSLGEIKYFMTLAPSSFYITLPITLAFTLFVFLLVRFSSLSWAQFGLTLSNWKRSLFEGFVYTLPILGLLLITKLILFKYTDLYSGERLFDPYNVIQNPAYKKLIYWFAFNFPYVLIIAPIQEFIARGVLQGLFEKFLTVKDKVWGSILVSNLIFSTIHIFFSVPIGILVFVGGIFIGWIYSRTHNLLGCWLSHCMLGLWVFSILGLMPR